MPNELQPPSAASRLLSWIRDPHLPQILGDLSEEYGERARSLGAAAARRWYWREAIRNAGVLLWRKRIVGTTLIAVLAVLSVNSLVNILFLKSDRILIAVRWHIPHRVLAYRDQWGMRWPVGFDFDIICASIVALAAGYLFALAAPDRAKHLRIAAVALWLLNCLWFTVWASVWIHPRGLVGPVAMHMMQMKQDAILQFLAREVTAAGAFFIGAGLVRRKLVATQ
jgi:hypothetical protein